MIIVTLTLESVRVLPHPVHAGRQVRQLRSVPIFRSSLDFSFRVRLLLLFWDKEGGSF